MRRGRLRLRHTTSCTTCPPVAVFVRIPRANQRLIPVFCRPQGSQLGQPTCALLPARHGCRGQGRAPTRDAALPHPKHRHDAPGLSIAPRPDPLAPAFHPTHALTHALCPRSACVPAGAAARLTREPTCDDCACANPHAHKRCCCCSCSTHTFTSRCWAPPHRGVWDSVCV